MKKRVTWIEIKGIPARAWREESMVNIAQQWGDYITSDDGTLAMDNKY